MSRRSLLISIGLGVLGIIVLALQTPVLDQTRDLVWGGWVATIGRVSGMTLTVTNDVSEQLARLTAENARLRAELEDYKRLRRQIGSPAVADRRSILAAVTGRPVDSLRAEYVINRGAKDGIVLGAPVVTHGSVLVGFVQELQDNTSLVRLMVHPSMRVPAQTVGEQPGQGLVQGKSYTSVFLVSVPRDVSLSNGQEIVSVSETQLLPQGLLIGQISGVENEEHEPYQRARLALPYDPDELKVVSILVPP